MNYVRWYGGYQEFVALMLPSGNPYNALLC